MWNRVIDGDFLHLFGDVCTYVWKRKKNSFVWFIFQRIFCFFWTIQYEKMSDCVIRGDSDGGIFKTHFSNSISQGRNTQSGQDFVCVCVSVCHACILLICIPICVCMRMVLGTRISNRRSNRSDSYTYACGQTGWLALWTYGRLRMRERERKALLNEIDVENWCSEVVRCAKQTVRERNE